MSQIFVSGPIFNSCKRTGTFLVNSSNIFCTFYRKRTKTLITNPKHFSLQSNVLNKYVKFEVCGLYGKRDFHVQKLNLKKSFTDRFLSYSWTSNRIFVNFLFFQSYQNQL